MSGAPYQSPKYNPAPEPQGNTNPVLGIISLVTGILSFIPGCCCFLIGPPLALVAIGTGVVGLVMANQGKLGGKGFAIAGTICGAIAVLLWILFTILQVMGAVDPNVIRQQLEQMQNNAN